MNRQQHILTKILQKIHVFKGLSVEQAALLIQICKSRAFESNTQIYEAGEPSVDMLVLVQGKLRVLSRTGQQLAEVEPGASTGEMGVFTGHPRAATIVAAQKSMALVIEKPALRNLLNREPDIKGIVLENVVELLAQRLAETNEQVARLKAQSGEG
jgi:CRP-like cAMP-binding protein